MTEPVKEVRAEGIARADAAAVFELIADPARQPSWDGNNNLDFADAGQRVTAVGDVFVMNNQNGKVRDNHVVAFEEGRVIAWKTAPHGEPTPGHQWGWELEPQPDGGTRVVHTYDWTNLDPHDAPRQAKAAAMTPEKLQASIDRLIALADQQ